MDEKIYSLAKSLNEELNNDPRVVKLNELEKALNDSYEAYTLSNKKDEALEEYTRLKDIYPEDSEELRAALLKVKDAKEKLNNFPLVKEYLAQYALVRDLYLEVDNILFSNFRKGKC